MRADQTLPHLMTCQLCYSRKTIDLALKVSYDILTKDTISLRASNAVRKFIFRSHV